MIKHALHYLINDKAHFMDSCIKKIAFFLPDKIYISLRYRFYMGTWINWKKPKTFTEKINWLKIYNRQPQFTQMVDKYAVKDYVSNIIGEDYIIPTLGVWNSIEEVDFSSLPEQFVMKTTHGGGSCGIIVCKAKSRLNYIDVRNKIKKALKIDIYREYREWPYKNVKKRILVEKYMVPKKMQNNPLYDLTDYKFYCFNGEPIYCQVIRNRNEEETIDFYDMDWNHQVFVGLNPNVCNGKTNVDKPLQLEKMKDICRKLSKSIPFVRIDLYNIDNNIYFGEITFFPASGFGAFSPNEWNKKLGDLIDLESK